MRSVVVVLPPSMWAMIPMFRVFSSVNLRGMGSLSSSTAVFVALPDTRAEKRALRARVLLRGGGARGRWLCLEGLHSQDGTAARHLGVLRGRFAPERCPTIAGVRPLEPRATRVAAVSRRWVPSVLLAVLVLASGALIVAEFLTFAEVRVIAAVPPDGTRTAGVHHGYALAVIAMATIPWRSARCASARGRRPSGWSCSRSPPSPSCSASTGRRPAT